MNKVQLKSFRVKRYRSLLDVKIDVDESYPTVICGENNIGKTNFLRAMNVFFNHWHTDELYDPEEDLPHHIYHGSRGGGSKTEFEAEFIDGKETTQIKVTFNADDRPTYKIDGEEQEEDVMPDLFQRVRFLFIESHNINLPELISTILEKDGLLPLDAKRSKQSKPLKKLDDFIKLSQKAIADIEKELNECFAQLVDFDGVLKDKKIKINFAEFEKLRDAVKNMTSITLFDGNSHNIASKGSGAQRAVFIALMQYISQNSKSSIIWGIDEPEAFLQPKLQKQVANVFEESVKSKKQQAIITTHSQHFIDLKNLKSSHVFEGTLSPRQYKRKPDQVFYEVSTSIMKTASDFEKASLIKQHLGISNNDGWEVLPHNVLVEGEEDKKYLETLFALLSIPVPNIVWSGGASKVAGYLQYYNIFAKDLPYKPTFVCVFDNDQEGRDQSQKLKPKSYSNITVSIHPLIRYDGKLPENKKNTDWEIEDFLPADIVLDAINNLLKQEKYKKLTVKNKQGRTAKAHENTQVLKYAENCCAQRNPDKKPLEIDNEGRKKQICNILCSLIQEKYDHNILTKKQKDFLKNLCSS